ncbi:MAG TPA: NUDIX domain-containing protein [Chloroflexota bacterium]|nr:NUDIX domain-containing protein [Chloroflexota bacterium]
MIEPRAPEADAVEYFDLYSAAGVPLGIRKERTEVHRAGDWHRSIALWIVRSSGAIVLQRRSAAKDTWPGKLTASVSGHYAAGETLTDVLREAWEELGMPVTEAELIPLGTWVCEARPEPAVIDRELVDVFLWPTDRALTAFQPDPSEVSALVELPARDLLRLSTEPEAVVESICLPVGDDPVLTFSITREDLVPTHDYHARLARAALARAAGQPKRGALQ